MFSERSRREKSQKNRTIYRERMCRMTRKIILTVPVLILLNVLPVTGSLAAGRAAESSRIEAVAFDAFPIFDPRPAFAVIRELFPDKGEELRQLWFTKIFAYTWLRTAGETRYKEFPLVMEDALRHAAANLDLELSVTQEAEILGAFRRLPVWPDVLPVLKELRAGDLRIVFLSNMSEDMLRANLRHNGIEDLFDHVISTDRVRAFKPAPAAYQAGMDALGLDKEAVVFVAFAGWDAAGAKWFGYPTYWVNRLNAAPENLDAAADGESRGLSGLMEFIAGYNGSRAENKMEGTNRQLDQ